MAESGPTLEARLVIRLADIFPDHGEDVIRGAVYSVLVESNGAIHNEDDLLIRCLDGLLVPPGTPVNNATMKRRVNEPPGTCFF